MVTLHLMTQRGQPYGSERRCCESCGLMLVSRPDSFWTKHAWTNDPALYRHYPSEAPHFPHELVPCASSSQREQGGAS